MLVRKRIYEMARKSSSVVVSLPDICKDLKRIRQHIADNIQILIDHYSIDRNDEYLQDLNRALSDLFKVSMSLEDSVR